MSVRRYRLEDGRYVPRQAVNNHHTFWPNRIYEHGEEQRFRNIGGFVLPTLVTNHNELHATMYPPPKPSKQLREQIAEFRCSLYEPNVYDEFERLVQFIGDVANSAWSAERADEAFRIHENLVEQSKYITRLEPVYARV